MKTLSKTKIEKAKRLADLNKQAKDIEKESKELKEFFKAEIQEGVLEAGDIAIVVSKKQRTSLDKDALIIEFGEAKIKRFELVTEYLQVDIKKAA